MGLSTNVLWHQTDFNGLRAIVANKRFACSYSLETIMWKGSELVRAFPMISFCDIPFADIHDYLTNKDGEEIGKYGKYTIGMKRSWGRNNGLSPVWYRDKHSASLRLQKKIYDNLGKKEFVDYDDEEKFLWHVTANTKNNEGKLKKKGFESYRFYDEREMRFVPDFDQIIECNLKPSMSEEEYDAYKASHEGHSLIPEIQIPFAIDDIAYILVSSANKINDVKNLFQGEDCRKIAFLSYKQIMQDIIGISHNREV